MAMIIERRSDVKPCREIIFHARKACFKDMTSFPKLGAFIHIFIKPLITDGKMEFLDKEEELGVERSKEGKNPLKELDRHEVIREINTFKIIYATSEEGVEAID